MHTVPRHGVAECLSDPQVPDIRVGLPKADGHVLRNPSVNHCCIGVGSALHELLNGLRAARCPHSVAQTNSHWRTLLDERQCPIVACGAGALSAWPWTAADQADGLEAAFASPALLIEFVESLATLFSSHAEELVVATVLLEHLVRKGRVCLRPHTVRVLVLTLLTVAHKVVHDSAVALAHFVDAATPYFPLLTYKRLEALEAGVLEALDWELPTAVDYQIYTNELYRLADAYLTSRGGYIRPGGTPVPDILGGFML